MNPSSLHFSFEAQGKIWQLLADTQSNMLVGEVRKEEDQSISFFKLNLSDGSTKLFEIDEVDWWTTMFRLCPPYMLLERYRDPQNPTDKDLLVYNYMAFDLVRNESDFQLEELQGDLIVGYRPGYPDEKKTIPLQHHALGISELFFPVNYPVRSEGFEIISEFLALGDVRHYVGAEYLEHNNYIIIAYYERLGTNFDRKLLVMRGDVEIYHETIDIGLKGFASGAFFIAKGLLIFIKNGYLLNGIKL